jgi:hypothetical protein
MAKRPRFLAVRPEHNSGIFHDPAATRTERVSRQNTRDKRLHHPLLHTPRTITQPSPWE